MHGCVQSLRRASPCRPIHGGNDQAQRCRAFPRSSPEAWRKGPTRNLAVWGWCGVLRLFPSGALRALQQSLQSMSLSFQRARAALGRRGPETGVTAGRAMTTARVKDSLPNRFFAFVALHNNLNLLESGRAAAELNGSPQLLSGSSRTGAAQVEFVNHPEAVSLQPMCGGHCACGSGGWGAPKVDGKARRALARRASSFGAGTHDASPGRHDGTVPRSRFLHP